MTLTNMTKFNIQPLVGEVDEDALNEPGANEAEAIPLSVTHEAEASDWTYSATAEDNGTAGILDGEPGIIYNGPSGNFARLVVGEIDTIEGSAAPEAEVDTAAVAVFINSVVFDYAEEGFTEHNSEIAVEHGLDVNIGPLNESDVIRIGIVYKGEEADADIDTTAGTFTITG